MHPSLAAVHHRPWPLPSGLWAWRQTWHDLLFIHWPVDRRILEPLIPAGATLDTFEDRAWLSLAPFRMSGVTLRGLPSVPWLSAFPEMNLRTYVTAQRKPGVWFLRMDAGRALAVWAARARLNLPYVWSTMHVRTSRDGDVSYQSAHGESVFDATYRPIGHAAEAPPGSLEQFLVERYCLYCVRRRRLWRVNIHHRPWALQPARVDVRVNSIPSSRDLPSPGAGALVQFSRRMEVIGWPPEACDNGLAACPSGVL